MRSAAPEWYRLETHVPDRDIRVDTHNYSPDLRTDKIKFKWKDGEHGEEHDAEIKYIRRDGDFNIWEAYYNIEYGKRILTTEPPLTNVRITSITREQNHFYLGANLHHIIHMFFHVVKNAPTDPTAGVPDLDGGSSRPRKSRKRRTKRRRSRRLRYFGDKMNR